MHRFLTILAVVLLATACGLQPSRALTGTVIVGNGPYQGTYEINRPIPDGEQLEVGCWIAENGWVTGFSTMTPDGPIRDMQVGRSEAGEVDVWVTFDTTGPIESGTLRMRGPGADYALDGGVTGDRLEISAMGVTDDGTELAVDLSCSPLVLYPGLEG
jgi:hypothetical protein